MMQPNVKFFSPLTIEAMPCVDCGAPFMVSVQQAVPIASGLLVAPHKAGNGNQQPQIMVKPVLAWRLCLNCLRRETTKPTEDGKAWEMVKHTKGENRRVRRMGRAHG